MEQREKVGPSKLRLTFLCRPDQGCFNFYNLMRESRWDNSQRERERDKSALHPVVYQFIVPVLFKQNHAC